MSWRLGAMLARAAIGLLAVPIYTRVLGISQWGLLALFQAAVAPLVLLDLGFGTATVKYVAESLARGDRTGAARFVHTTLITNALVGAVGAAGLNVAAGWLATGVFKIPVADVPRAVLGFRLVAFSWLLGLASSSFGAVIAARQRYDIGSKLATASVVISTSLCLAIATARRDAVAVVLGQIAVGAATSAVQLLIATRLLPEIWGLPRWSGMAFRRSFRFGMGQTVALAGSLLSGWSDRYVLGMFFAPALVGFYATAHALYSQLYGAFCEMGEVLFPAVSHRHGAGDLQGARQLSLLAGWTLTSMFGVCAVVLAVAGGDFLHLWISADAARAAGATLRLLCVAGILGMTAIAPFYYVLGVGETRWNALSAPVIGLVVTIAAVALVPRQGLAGVGYGLILGVAVRWLFVVAIWRVHFARDFTWEQFTAHVWAPPLVSLALTFALTRVHDALGRPPTWPWLIVESVVTLGVAGALQLAVGEALPGGARRRADVLASFAPLLQGLRRSRSR